MNIIQLTPYTSINNQIFDTDVKITIKDSDFKNISNTDGKTTFAFIDCVFRNVEIDNYEAINFNSISILFSSCFINEITVNSITTKNISLYFSSCILRGRIRNPNLETVFLNNCFLNESIYLQDLNNLTISLTEDNIYPLIWKKLFKKIVIDIDDILLTNHSIYVYDCKKFTFSVTERSSEKRGLYVRKFSSGKENKIGYLLNETQKQMLKFTLYIQYSAEVENSSTKVINAKLSSLCLSGFSNGEVLIENSKIDNCYIRNFTAQKGFSLHNIKPYRQNLAESYFEIHKSNLDKAWFDNIAFDDYSLIALYRNKMSQTLITSCDFPENYKQFEKFKMLQNINYPNIKDDNYLKLRYETFLQLKKILESSGNIYEALKFQAVSHEALKQIKSLSSWDKLILNINSISNNHGLSIKTPLLLTFLVSGVLYIFYLFSIDKICWSYDFDKNLIGYFFSFIDITHRNDFLVKKEQLNSFSLAIDYLNKIVVSFLIYQFVAAFRKYGKR